MDLSQAFRESVASEGRRSTWGPTQYVEAWQSLVEETVDGYAGDLYEYENDLAVRDDLERAIGDQNLQGFEEWPRLVNLVRTADDTFQALIADGPSVRSDGPWWRRRLPPRTGVEMAQDAARLFGVVVQVA
jgi:hypothetical protein